MKSTLTFLVLLLGTLSATSQTPITVVDTTSAAAASSFTYGNDENTYNWGVTPNNAVVTLNGFTAGEIYTYQPALTGNVKLRRVDNAKTTGNFSLQWVQTVTSGTNTYNMLATYQNDMESFLNNHIYNKGTDNIFDNTALNSNNIERFDWLSSSYSTPSPDKAGFAVFDKVTTSGTHDAFAIAAITSVDDAGDPLTYGNIVRVVAADYGDPGPALTYRIVKGAYGSDLLDAGIDNQNRGGVLITLQDLGITANTPIFGYSLFSGDLPVSALPADLVDYTNTTFFPTNTGSSGGLDLLAITGISVANSVLPVSFLSFNAVETNNIINLKWAVEDESSAQRYEVERSEDGMKYIKIKEISASGSSAGSNTYLLADDVSSVLAGQLFYRIKQYDRDGSVLYSKIISVRLDNTASFTYIYPNPVKGSLYLNIPAAGNSKAMISVFNSAGAKVIMQPVQLASGNNSFTLNSIGRLSKGIYQLSVKWMGSGRIITKSFSKQ